MTNFFVPLLVGILTLGVLATWLWRPGTPPVSQNDRTDTTHLMADAPPPDDEGTPPRRG
ncbi:hypothetical protein L5470_01260 [Synechococcus sp. PCC 6717]|jgi:hypothetical protein|nr:hypothetical protein [Synechococcus sp. PCC 6716]MCI3279623.1 hypothetical protein [Synechococcus sp. PCC 6717]